jgi:hypothetical protein
MELLPSIPRCHPGHGSTGALPRPLRQDIFCSDRYRSVHPFQNVADLVESLTFGLCHTCGRATKAISIAVPCTMQTCSASVRGEILRLATSSQLYLKST